MIWLTWRQHRSEVFVIMGVVALIVVFLLVTRYEMTITAQRFGVTNCFAHPGDANCGMTLTTFMSQFDRLSQVPLWLNVAPILLGAFVGAPLVARELEQHTHHMVWTQGITRVRWLLVKVALIFGVCLLSMLLVTALVMWWHDPFDQWTSKFSPIAFDVEGIVPLGYTAYALALGIASGVFLRKAVPAMGATLAGFLALRVPVESLLRPYYLPPITVRWDPTQADSPTTIKDWTLSSLGWVDQAGHPVGDKVYQTCTSGEGFLQCTHAHGWLLSTIYQPASRFWTFQGIETAIFVLAAAVLLTLSIWWVEHRLS